jgi:hypothetical protein
MVLSLSSAVSSVESIDFGRAFGGFVRGFEGVVPLSLDSTSLVDWVVDPSYRFGFFIVRFQFLRCLL